MPYFKLFYLHGESDFKKLKVTKIIRGINWIRMMNG